MTSANMWIDMVPLPQAPRPTHAKDIIIQCTGAVAQDRHNTRITMGE